MIDRQPSTEASAQQARMIPIHERSVLVGGVIVVNGYRANRISLKGRFAEGGYQVHETKHFWLFTRAEEPKTILVHWFATEEMTTNVPGYLVEELKPFRLVNSNHQLIASRESLRDDRHADIEHRESVCSYGAHLDPKSIG